LKLRRIFSLILFLGVISSFVFSQDKGESILRRGIEQYKNSDFSYAIYDFREITLDDDYSAYHGDAYFWIAKSFIALNQLEDAEKNLEYFLLKYPGNPNYPEGFYQKGRLLYLQREYQKSIQAFYSFIESYPDNPYIPNSYYWIGESLYQFGQVEKALTIFKHLVSSYPFSYKIEAAKYRISLINLEKRERELLKFLKWSHEESLKTLEEFQIREKTYEQALSAYQKKLAKFAEEGSSSQVEALTLEVIEKDKEIISLKNQISKLKRENSSLSKDLQALKTQSAEAAEREIAKTPEPERTEFASTVSESNLRRLLTIKNEALKLKEFYINWLEKELESK